MGSDTWRLCNANYECISWGPLYFALFRKDEIKKSRPISSPGGCSLANEYTVVGDQDQGSLQLGRGVDEAVVPGAGGDHEQVEASHTQLEHDALAALDYLWRSATSRSLTPRP